MSAGAGRVAATSSMRSGGLGTVVSNIDTPCNVM